MKKIFLGIVLSFGLIAQSYSQDTLRFANCGFEDWTTESGYSVLGLISFFSSYVHPTTWDRPYYHMNKEVSKYGITTTINTDVPVHNFKKETKSVTEGKTAACLSSFQLNDVISSSAIQYGSDYLKNYGLTTDMICASILSTGNLTRNGLGTYVKQIVNLGLLGCGGTKNEAELYDSLKNYDMNKYVQGGLALNGFYPTRLHGSYKYVSNSTTDAGEVIIIGTHYDSDAKKRLMVGGGYKNDLNTAKTAYEDFDVYYRPFTNVEPDSLIIICMSSGLTNCADESKLYLDNFFLLSDCFDVENLVASNVTTNSAIITWDENRHISWEYAYGIKGFNIDEATPISCNEPVVELTELEAETEYEVYVRTICSETNMSDWVKVEFTTEAAPVPVCEPVANLVIADITLSSAVASWNDMESSYEVVSGAKDFSLENAEVQSVTANEYSLANLTYNREYDVYVRNVCSDELKSEWTKVSFTTLDLPTCDAVSELSVSEISQYGATVSWAESEFDYEIAYGESGFELAEAEVLKPTTNSFTLSDLQLKTAYDVYVRAVKENYYNSEWTKVSFTTLDLPTCDAVTEIVASEVSQYGAVISWAESEFDYEIAYGESGFDVAEANIVKPTTNSFTLSDLQLKTAYDVYVRAVKDGYYDGEWIKVSFITLDLPTCEVVSEVSVSEVSQYGATVSWAESDFDYEIAYGESGFDVAEANIVKPTTNSFTLSDLQLKTAYDVYVRAVKDGYYDGEWTKVSFTTLDLPTCEVVSEVSVSEISQYGAIVSWAESEFDYEIAYGESGFDVAEANIMKPTTNSFTLSDLQLTTTYDVYVRAVKENYYNGEWTKVSFTTLDLPTCDAVTEIVASEVSQYGAVISWAESEFDYEIAYGESGFELAGVEVLKPTTNSFTLSDLQLKTAYDVYVRAVKENYYDGEWTKVSFTTLDLPTCDAVTEIVASEVSQYGAVISWAESEFDYEIAYGESGFELAEANILKPTTNSFTLSDLQLTTTYDVCVRAVKDGYYDGEWTKVSFTTLDLPTCDVVTEIVASEVSQYGAIVSWAESEFDYEIAYGESGFELAEAEIIKSTGNSYSLEDLSLQTAYDVYVRAVKDGYYDGEWTKVSFTTLDKPTCPSVATIQLGVVTDSSVVILFDEADGVAYEIIVNDQEGQQDVTITQIVAGTYQIAGLLAETTYEIAVRATKEDSYASEWTKVECTTLLPSADQISGIKVIQTDTTWYVVWDKSNYTYEIAFGPAGYDVENALLYSTKDTVAVLGELVDGETYELYVRAVANGFEPSEWNHISFQYQKPEIVEECSFAPVENLIVESITESSVTLTWDNPEENPEYEWFDVLLENLGCVILPSQQEPGSRITQSQRVIENLSAGTSYMFSVSVGSEECKASEWNSIVFETPQKIAVETVAANNVVVYPTLSKGSFTVMFDGAAEAKVTVIDLNGSVVKTIDGFASGTEVNISRSGVYNVEVQINGVKTVKTVVIY